MPNIRLSSGEIAQVDCLSCAIISGQVEPNGGVVIETDYFHAHQDVAYPIKGLVILASKRHIHCFDELNNDEKLDYINLLKKLDKLKGKYWALNTFIIFTTKIRLIISILGWCPAMNG